MLTIISYIGLLISALIFTLVTYLGIRAILY